MIASVPSRIFAIYEQVSIVYKFVPMKSRKCLALMLALLSMALPTLVAGQAQSAVLGITVLQGQNGVVDETHTVEFVVRVTRPGATVIFRLMPGSGTAFPGGAVQVSVLSNADGIARSGTLSSVDKGGDFEVDIQASLDGQVAMTSVHATNHRGGGAGTGKPAKKSHTMLWIAVIGGAGAGLAVAASMKGGGGSAPSTPSGPPVTITAGQPSIGAPQ